ncbi:MAG: tyrosine-protein phosphatase [Solirubrobacteraceae bacterium]
MIDLHCHILPNLDDGALSMQDSVAMAKQARDDGIEAVCATPHIRHDHDVHIPEIASRVAALQSRLDREGVGVSILPGGEVAQTCAARLTDEELRRVSLGGAGGWVLLEPAPGPLGDDLAHVVDGLARRKSRTIVAHPERHAGADLEERLLGLVRRGCLIQWTAQFVLDAKPEDLVLRYARDGLVHLLASDAHSSLAGRRVEMASAFERLVEVCSPEWVQWMAEHAPRAIVAGEPLEPPRAGGGPPLTQV